MLGTRTSSCEWKFTALRSLGKSSAFESHGPVVEAGEETVASFDFGRYHPGRNRKGKTADAACAALGSVRAITALICLKLPDSVITNCARAFRVRQRSSQALCNGLWVRLEAAERGTRFLNNRRTSDENVNRAPAGAATPRIEQTRRTISLGTVLEMAITNRDGPAGVTADPFARILLANERYARHRKIVLRVEYFVGCYAKGTGNNIHHIAKHAIEQLPT